ncbi:MAG: FAD/NAD(P)-binding oxidoreductase [Deltaproteobacteria bacterium]|nr:MAG: FAD/NAD(P)-binding oxidoreductase [Deltaproteobacteria bacterium]
MLYDAAIIGGGVIGCAIARELSRYAVRVVLIEKECEVGFGTSKSNSGIIHAGHHAPPETLKGQLVVEGNRAFPQLAEELGFGFKQVGEIVVARNADELPALEALKARGEAKGVPGLELWDRERLLREEPNLSPTVAGGLFAPTAGVINPYECCFGLIQNARMNGVELLVESPVLGIDRRDGFLSIKTPRQLLHARFVINAAGVHAAKIAAMVGLTDFTIQPRKGEEYMLDKRMKGVVRRIIFPVPAATTKGTLVIPTFDGTIMVGPTAEDVDEHDISTTDAGARSVFDFVRTLVPSLHPRDTIAEFAGLRAVSDSNDFIIGPTAVPGFINVAGIQSPGLTAAPAIGRYVRDILKDEGLTLVERDDFEPRVRPIPRFSALSMEEKRARIAADPASAHIVCRCEEVTESEVVEAIDQGARTLDGLKFRVRAGMGRCQGGFCTWRCMELLSERLGLPIEAITKRGGGSWLVIPRLDADPNEEASR